WGDTRPNRDVFLCHSHPRWSLVRSRCSEAQSSLALALYQTLSLYRRYRLDVSEKTDQLATKPSLSLIVCDPNYPAIKQGLRLGCDGGRHSLDTAAQSEERSTQ